MWVFLLVTTDVKKIGNKWKAGADDNCASLQLISLIVISEQSDASKRILLC